MAQKNIKADAFSSVPAQQSVEQEAQPVLPSVPARQEVQPVLPSVPGAARQEAQQVLPSVPVVGQQDAKQEAQQVLPSVPGSGDRAVQPALKPNYPSWPTSKPGPHVTTPPPGMLPTHIFRPEQMTEIGYNQETGEPVDTSPERSLPDEEKTGSVSFDLKPRTGQEALGKRKQRL